MRAIWRRSRLAGLVVTGLIFTAAPRLAAQGAGPDGATAKCTDGSYSRSKSEKDACVDHDGISVWYGILSRAMPNTSRHGDPLVTLEAVMAQEAPNEVVRADVNGTVQDRFTPDSADVARYTAFMVYLDKVEAESACRKASNHCALCPPSHKIYCTNVPSFLPLMAF